MMLWTFHMGTQNDLNNVQNQEKILTMKDELQWLTDRLSEYKPNKIFVEFEKKHQEDLNQLCDQYKAGGLQNLTNEIYTVAFPLAEKMQAEVIAADWYGMADIVVSAESTDLCEHIRFSSRRWQSHASNWSCV